MNAETFPNISRRNVLRAAIGIPVGIAVGALTAPFAEAVNHSVTELTDRPTGNAGVQEMAEEACKDAPDPDTCTEEWELKAPEKVIAVTVAPITEEFAFRAIPSVAIDIIAESRAGDTNPIDSLIHGKGGIKMTRSEVTAGILSSILFGFAHNVTDKGVNTETIPVSQAADGFIYWILQRRFGYLTNTSAHAVHNLTTLLT